MNIADINLETGTVPGTAFLFSGARPDTLTASSYTLVTFAVDVSGSVDSFRDELVRALNLGLEACRKSPQAENLLVRTIKFADQLAEVHGFAPLLSLPVYDPADFSCNGMTALYDAVGSSIGATQAYGDRLKASYYAVNAVIFIITDGIENASRVLRHPAEIKVLLEKIRREEQLGGITAVLVGINAEAAAAEFGRFKDDGGLDAFVDIADATPGRLAKFANFVSRSISSSSKALASQSAAPVVTGSLTI